MYDVKVYEELIPAQHKIQALICICICNYIHYFNSEYNIGISNITLK